MLKQPDITMNAATCCFSIGLYTIYTDEALFCHVLLLLILCVRFILCVYSHFENQLGIINITLGQCLM